jgi:glycine/D-amino acid oxidase-like deaminating enzyme
MSGFDVIVVGGGIFGVTAALELRQRGHDVLVLDPGPLPHPLAASTDISKVVRMEYGADEQYMEMVEQALPGWRQWNEALGAPLYHEVGVLMLTREPMAAGGFEHESYQLLRRRGHDDVQRLDEAEIARRFPAWQSGAFVDGFYHAEGGYAESGRVVAALMRLGQREGVRFHPGQKVVELVTDGERVSGVRTVEGEQFAAGQVLIAAGTWTHELVPELKPYMRSVGQPVFHLKATEAALFTPPQFPVFTADVARTGWYGFPLHPHERVVKVANHGAGHLLHPEQDERLVSEAEEEQLRAFLAAYLPALADAPVVYRRCCLYCDTLDEHLWIDQHPQREGLVVAAGGSGHGFKFAPVLGPLIADAVEGKENRWLERFRWRTLAPGTRGEEAARYHE